MKKLTISDLAIYGIVTVILAVTTFLSPEVYGSWWFVAIWAVFAIALTATICATRMWRHAGRFILHISLLAMLGGGLLTWLTKTEGIMHISAGQEAQSFADFNGKIHKLPTPVKLHRFETEYYPGGKIAKDYRSHLEIGGEKRTVSMNNIVELDGYRLLQYSFDEEGGTVLSVSKDPYGMPLSYAGYIMFAIGGLLIMLTPSGKFRRLLRNISMIAIMTYCGTVNSSAGIIEGISRQSADSLKTQQVLYNGRTVTFNTLSRDVLLKIHGKSSYRGLTSEQTLISLKLFPERWKDEPLIRIKEKKVSEALGISGSFASLSDLFDSNGNYRVQSLYYTLGHDHRRAVEDLDEKAGIILTLISGELIKEPPRETGALSDTHVSIELLYNAMPLTEIIFMTLLAGFAAGMVIYLISLSGRRVNGMISRIPFLLLIVSFIFSVAAFGMQWYLSGRLPLANTFETLQFVVIIFELILLLAGHRNQLILSLGLLMAGALALVAHLVASNPVVTQLMPVLHSGWLSLHVSLVMASYAMLGFTFIIAMAGLLLPSSSEKMRDMAVCMLYPGTYLLGLGIFSGAVWANVSWGQYWTWDPKETWALVTLLVYALPLHTAFRSRLGIRKFHLYLLFAVLSIAMTYFGVNYLDSMHAYN